METWLDELLDILSEGLVDPECPAVLHPNLRREYAVVLEGRFRAEGVTPVLLNSVAVTFERIRGEMGAAPGAAELSDRLRELVRHSYQPVYPFLGTFLRVALHRVDGVEQWNGLLLFLDRTAVLMRLAANSGPLPAPPLPWAPPPPPPPGTPPPAPPPPELVIQPEARFCLYCGSPRAGLGGAAPCRSCHSVRPLVPADATLIRCAACHGFTPGIARYCEWCGREFAA